MLQTVHNSEFSRTMDLFKEIDDLGDLFLLEKNTKLSCPEEGYDDLQSKYSSLHENYAKEIENSKKVEKCLIKCLKFYSKLSKKYEVQQEMIRSLEESLKEKANSLEEAQKNEEKLKGVIQVYKTERALYAGKTSSQLRKEKELLLDICCKLIGESWRSHTASTFSSLLLRKFKKDLSEEKINLLISKEGRWKDIKVKDELGIGDAFGLKSEFGALKDEIKSEDKYSSDVTKEEVKAPAEDISTNQSDLGRESSSLRNENSQEGHLSVPFEETEPCPPSVEEPPLSLQPLCTDNEEQHQSDLVVNRTLTECDMTQERNESPEPGSPAGREKASVRDASSENVESQFEEQLEEPTLTSEKQNEPPLQPAKGWTSIFDVSGGSPSRSDSGAENVAVESELFSEVSFTSADKSEDVSFVTNTNRLNLELTDNEDDSILPYEREVFRIFREMSSIRVLSPIRQTVTDNGTCTVAPNEKKDRNAGSGQKRNSQTEENLNRNKKLKSGDENPGCCLLDSIMSAMSVQNEEFKSKKFGSRESGETAETSESSCCEFGSPRSKTRPKRTRKENCKTGGNSGVVCQSSERIRDRQQAMERLVTEEIKSFVSSAISSKEDADKSVKHCVSALTKKPEDVIAKCIVGIVLENIDEAVEVFERPAPPLTKTQHRLIVLLSVFRTLDWNADKISGKILSLLFEKLFPDNFFWPDDCVEAATRFYAALCRARNDPKTLWKFCLSAMTDMRQRCPLVVFTALKTWPDVLHDASTLKNNTLAVTAVNLFLHMPRTEGLRNGNQKRKLEALKHLLVNFYQFKVNETMEGYAKRMVEGIGRGDAGAEKSLVLLSKCRDEEWTLRNVVPALKSGLAAWSEGSVPDSVAGTMLSVIKQICPPLAQGSRSGAQKSLKELALCLSEILTSGKKSHDSEVSLVEVLLLLKQYPEVRKAICEWIPKTAIEDELRNEIINATAENILRELNRKKEPKNSPAKKKQWKKPRGKKKKGKKKKKNEKA